MPPLPPVTRAVILTWVGLWVLAFLADLGGVDLAGGLALRPAALLAGDLGALPGVVTHALVHQGLLHLFFNVLLFAGFAPEVERLFGPRRFLRFLLGAALFGAAVALLLALLLGGVFRYPVLGGSGLVMAALAVQAVVYPFRLLSLFGLLTFRMRTFVLVLVGVDALFLLADLAGRPDGVANHVHLAGALWGWLAVSPRAGRLRDRFRLPRALDWRAGLQRRRARKRAGEERELDRILGKISREGLQGLTPGERRFLERRSKRKEGSGR